MPLGAAETIKLVYELSVVDKGTKALLASERAVQRETRETARAMTRGDTATKRSGTTAVGTARKRVSATTQERQAVTSVTAAINAQTHALERAASAERRMSSAQRGRGATGAGVARGGGLGAGAMGGVAAAARKVPALAAGAGAAVGIKAVIGAFVGFEKQMDRVQATAGATSKQMELMNAQAKQLGADTAFSAKEAADGMYQLSTAGFTAQQTMKILPGTLDLASASGTELAAAAELQAAAIRGFGLSAKDATRVADVLTKTVNSSAVEMSDLGETLPYVASTARQTGTSFEQVAAAAGILGDAGIKGSMAGTALRTSMLRLTDPTDKMIGVFESMGIEARGLAAVPLPEVIGRVAEGIKKLPTRGEKVGAISAIFGKEAAPAMLNLMSQGREEIDKLVKSLENSDGAAKKTARTMRDNVSGSWDEFTGSIETASITLVERHGPAMQRTLKSMTKGVNDLATKLSSPSSARFVSQVASDLRPVGKAIQVVGKFLLEHPRLVVAAAGAYASFKAARGVLKIANDIRSISTAIGVVGNRAARTRLAVLLANGAKGAAARIGRVLSPVGDVVASRMAMAADRGTAALGSSKKWRNSGRTAGRLFGVGLVAGFALGAAELGVAAQRQWDKIAKDMPGPDWLWSASALGRKLKGKRKGGRIPRMAVGGLVPILAAGGEMHVDGGRAAMIPGDPRRDSTLMFARPDSAIVTADGQARMMAGASLGQAIAQQAPHFAKGGKVPAGRYASTSYGPPWGGIQGTGVTATGVNLRGNPKIYGVAVDPRVIPLGSQIYIDPNPFGRTGAFRAFDTGGAIKGNRIDFYDWRGRKKQNAWGRRSVRISAARMRGVGTDEAPEGDVTARVPLTSGQSKTRAGLLQDAVAQGVAAGMSGLTRGETGRAATGARGARTSPMMEAIRGAMTATTREVTIPGAEGGGSASAAGATPRLRKMNAFAARASSKYPKYVYGGGHAGFSGPYDCSGYVSAILHAGNFLRGSPMTTDGFKNWGKKGSGKRITVGVRGSTGRSAHMMMRVGSSYWEAGSSGVGKRSGWSGSFPIRRHPAGYRRGGLVGDMGKIPTRIAQRLIEDPRALDPRSPEFVGFGLRRGGRIRRMVRGGVVGGKLGSALHAATTFRGGSLDALDAAIGGVVEARLEVLRAEVLKRVRRGGDKKTIQRLQSVIDLVDFELGRRIGRYQDVVEQRTAAIDRTQAGTERGLRMAGVDAGSPLGVAVLARGQALETRARAANLDSLRKALAIAQRTGNQEVIRDVTQRYREAQDALAESLVRQVELWRDQLRSLSEEVSARAQFATGLAGAGGSLIEAWQRTAGVQDTAAGMQQRATYTTGVTIPALRAQMQAAHLAQIVAASTGDVNGWRAAVQDAAGAAVEIANAQADAADLMRQAAMRAAQDVVDAAGHGRMMADLGLQRLELEQQLIGTHDSGGGAVGRADFIRRAIIPAIQGEVAALRVQMAAAQATGDAALATQIAEAIFAKENDVLEAQLAAQNAIKDNTDAMREQGGTTAFSYQQQTFTDLDAIRARVGA
jgi:TP901 family phage tail tape measure protein